MNEVARSDHDSGAESPATNTAPGVTTDAEMDAREASQSADQTSGDASERSERSRLPLDETFELLRNQRRRYVLQYLAAKGGEASLSELAEQIAAWENEKDVRQITSSERKRVYVGLYQCHLPKMDGMGVISFQKSKGSVERRQRADGLDPYLRPTAVRGRSSRTGPAVGLSVVGATLGPLAILFVSQSMLSVGVAALVVAAATCWGIATLWRDRSGDRPSPPEHSVA